MPGNGKLITEKIPCHTVGKGDLGAMICELYKSEIGQNRNFKTQEIAIKISDQIDDLYSCLFAGKGFL